MRFTYYTGWLLVALGIANVAGAALLGEPAFGAMMLVILAGTGAFLAWLAYGWDTPLEDTATLHEFGRPANATVTSVDDEKLSPDGTRTAKVGLHVRPVNEKAYKAKQTLVLPGGRVPFTGQEVTVKFDPRHRRSLVLLGEHEKIEDQIAVASRTLGGFTRAVGG